MEILDPLEPFINFVFRTMVIIGPILYLGGTIWVYVDALKMRNRSEKKEGLHPGLWLVLCLFLFNIVFPIYWIQRKPRNIWKSIGIIVFLWIIPVFIIGSNSYFSVQRKALQTVLNEQLRSVIKSGMSKDEIEYFMVEMHIELLNVDTFALQKKGLPTPIEAEIRTYIIGDNIGLFFFDSKSDTLITFNLLSREEMEQFLEEFKELSD